MTIRLRNRIEAAEAKVLTGDAGKDARLFFVRGYGEDAGVFLRSCGHTISEADRIVQFVPAADGRPVPAPLADLTAEYGRAPPTSAIGAPAAM